MPTITFQPTHPQIFSLTTPDHLLLKIHWEIRQLKTRNDDIFPTLAYHAFNCAVTIWHMADWVWEAAPEAERHHLAKTKGALKNSAKQQCRDVEICGAIANASKHRGAKDGAGIEVSIEVDWDASRVGELVTYATIMDRGVKREASEVFLGAADYWQRKLRQRGFIEDSIYEEDLMAGDGEIGDPI